MKSSVGKLTTLADIFSGFTFRNLPSESSTGNITIIQPKDFDHYSNQLLIDQALKTMHFQGDSKFFIQPGDILIGSKGKTTPIITIEETEAKIVASAAFIIIRPFLNLINSNFLAWYLQLPVTQNHFNSSKAGSTVLNLSIKSVQEAMIDIPPMPMQKAIGKIYYSLMQQHATQLALIKKYTLLINTGLYEQIH